MTFDRSSVVVFVGTIVAILLQLVIAPVFANISAQPNFLIAFALTLAIVRPDKSNTVLPFFLGLLFDLMGEGPVGAMAFLLVLFCFIAARSFSVLDNNTVFMPLVVLVASVFLIELIYAAIMLSFGVSAGFLDAFLYRALPCALFDSIACIVFYPLLARFLAPVNQDFGMQIPTLR